MEGRSVTGKSGERYKGDKLGVSQQGEARQQAAGSRQQGEARQQPEGTSICTPGVCVCVGRETCVRERP